MRGARAKQIRAVARQSPLPFDSGYYSGAGKYRGASKKLKNLWKTRGLHSAKSLGILPMDDARYGRS
jgi:hypothetical protein